MLFITPSSNSQAAKDYYTRQLERSDYYMKDAAEMPGQWHGLGTKLLGLKGEVKREDYFSLCDNQHPETGQSLTRNTRADRRVLYDFTFDAPKSVSLAYEVGGDERILEAFKDATRDTMREMETAMMARVRANGKDEDRVTGNMVWAGFVHRTTRPLEDGTPDPQLHCHATVFNATYDAEENKWKAAQFSNLVRDKGYYQAAFHSRLSANLADLTRIIHDHEDTKGLFCYKHVAEAVFVRAREAFACLTIARHSVCCYPIFSTSLPCCSSISGRAVPTAEPCC
jgi:conjugative relaxase-like TrwC/TraI family protein